MIRRKVVLFIGFVFFSCLAYTKANLQENNINENRNSQQDIKSDNFVDEEIQSYQRATRSCKNGKCVVENGNEVCKCPSDYGHFAKTYCKACNCGLDTSCTFVDQGFWKSPLIKCLCKPGSHEENGKCVGPCMSNPCKNGGKCDADGKGFQCNCIAPWKGKTCENNCDCGDYGVCRFENGRKKCKCALSTAELDGKCVECNCGIDISTCLFKSDGTKTCFCEPGFIDVNGKCKECNCFPNGLCTFELGQKKCICRPGFIERDGKCVDKEMTSTDSTLSSTQTTTILTSTSADKEITTSDLPLTPSLKTTILTSTTADCSCGEKTKSCEYTLFGKKKCECSFGYAQNNEYCEECYCGIYGSCSFEYGEKRCNCLDFATEYNGSCVYCNCGDYSKSCGYDLRGEIICECFPGYAEYFGRCKECDCDNGRCVFEYGQKKCICGPFTYERNGRCVDCYCGKNSKYCYLDLKDNKVCECSSGYAPFNGFCHECNCGAYAKSCFYAKNGTKVCNCKFGYTQITGYCSITCSEKDCVNGKCQIMGNGFKCRCNEGFTGQKCEEKINKQDQWMIMIVTVAFAIFIILSGIFCFLVRILRKISKK